MRRFFFLVAAAGAIAAAPCQKDSSYKRTTTGDFRDVVVTQNGKEIRGRVVKRYAPDEVMLLRDGKRVRIAAKRVKSMTTVNDHLREFFARDKPDQTGTAHAWILAEWAESKGLHATAELQALRVLLEDPDFAKAREFLGHQKSADGWRWRRGSTLMTRRKLDEYTAEWGHPLILPSEHFVLRTNAPLDKAVATLLDLERLYVWLFAEFGQALQLEEVVEPMDVHIRKSVDEFPAWTGIPLPYYWPQPNGDIAYSFFAEAAPRAEGLFRLGTEQILYNALAHGYSVSSASPKERYAAWLEVGFAQWVESRMTGPAGRATAEEPRLDRAQAEIVLQHRRLRLPNLLGIRYGMLYDLADDRPAYWAQSATFVAFLMERSGTRDKLLKLMHEALAKGKGSSSSTFDKIMGTRIEKLERPWLEWLEQQSGLRARRRR